MPLSTPPETGFSKGFGAGGSVSTFTFLLVSVEEKWTSPTTGLVTALVNFTPEETGGGKAATTLVSFPARGAAELTAADDFTSLPLFWTAGFDGWPALSDFGAADEELLTGSNIFATLASR